MAGTDSAIEQGEARRGRARQGMAGRRVKFEAILSDQGESDANTPEDVPLYLARMKATMKGLRHAFKNPKLPYFIGLVSGRLLDKVFLSIVEFSDERGPVPRRSVLYRVRDRLCENRPQLLPLSVIGHF